MVEIKYGGEETLRIRFEPESPLNETRAIDYRFSGKDDFSRLGGTIEFNFLDFGTDKRFVMPLHVALTLQRQLHILLRDIGS